MSNLYRGPSIDASYQVSYHLAKRFQRKSCFRNRTITKARHRYANNSQQLSVQVFVTRSICHGLSEILQGYLILVLSLAELPVVAMLVNASGQNEQS
jgi:hypothetical protein